MKKLYFILLFFPIYSECQLYDIDRYSFESTISIGMERFRDAPNTFEIGGNTMNLNPIASGFYFPFDIINVGYMIDYRFSVSLGTGFEFAGKRLENLTLDKDAWRGLAAEAGEEYVYDSRKENNAQTWRFHTLYFPVEFQYRLFTRSQKNDLSLSFNPKAVFFLAGGFNFKLFPGAKKNEEKPIYRSEYYGTFWSPLTQEYEENYNHWTELSSKYIKANKGGVAIMGRIGVFIPEEDLGGSTVFLKFERDLRARFKFTNGQDFFKLGTITLGYSYCFNDKFGAFRNKEH